MYKNLGFGVQNLCTNTKYQNLFFIMFLFILLLCAILQLTIISDNYWKINFLLHDKNQENTLIYLKYVLGMQQHQLAVTFLLRK